ncbi:Extracellular metalloproteinase 10 [Emydomyces testavorans]|uniref:Extracellular metalloproteinase 10 n=1 Tax=Emydomyces testavorans TaxID=2070801 RepID=A0AAF0IM91_9EURO|nr:Extracellular metalloproteinase 10 [Emydomyces testavorans]
MHGLLLAAGLLSLPFHAFAHPHQPATGVVPRRLDVNAYRLAEKSKYENTDAVSKNSAIASLSGGSYVDVATEAVKKSMPGATFRVVDDHYVGQNGIAHVRFRQTLHGLDIDNADFNVNVDNGKIFSMGNSFFTGQVPKEFQQDHSDPVQALNGARKVLQLPVKTENVKAEQVKTQSDNEKETFVFKGTSGALSDPKAKLVYLVKEDGTLALTWRIETDIGDNWLLSYVDAKDSNKVHNVVDYVAEAATYQV